MNKFARFLRSTPAKLAALTVPLMLGANSAMAAGGFDAAIDSVDLTGLAVKIGAAGLLIIGVAIAFKGSSLGKRVVSKV